MGFAKMDAVDRENLAIVKRAKRMHRKHRGDVRVEFDERHHMVIYDKDENGKEWKMVGVFTEYPHEQHGIMGQMEPATWIMVPAEQDHSNLTHLPFSMHAGDHWRPGMPTGYEDK